MTQIPSNIPLNSESPECEIIEQKAARQRGGSKDELRYWKRAIRSIPGSPYLYIELQRNGIRKKVSLETSNAAAAAHRAREVWRYVRLHGWDGYMSKFKPASLAQTDPSLGAFIDAVERTADLSPKTRVAYVNALRKIAADSFGLADDPRKFGGKRRKEWLERVHSVKLSALTPTRIQEWKRSFLAAADTDPLSQRSAKVSCNSFLRCARSLFSPKILEHLSLELPTPLPFAGAQFEPKPSNKYRSTFDVQALIGAARDELALSEPEVFKIFLLATFAGLRRKEIDLLEWSAFRWEAGVISITPTAHFAAKSEDSYADVAIDGELVELFRGYQARATGSFVIESAGELRPAACYNYYRCNEIFDRLTGWLRAHGVNSLKPLHTLRKEFGSMICASSGIHAASRALRHSAVAVTDQFYSDHRVRATVGLGHLLEPARIVEFPRQEVA